MTTNSKDMADDYLPLSKRILKIWDHYLSNGAKMWISNAPLAQVAAVWAKRWEVSLVGFSGFTLR